MADVQIDDGIIRIINLDVQDPKAAAATAGKGAPAAASGDWYAGEVRRFWSGAGNDRVWFLKEARHG